MNSKKQVPAQDQRNKAVDPRPAQAAVEGRGKPVADTPAAIEDAVTDLDNPPADTSPAKRDARLSGTS